MKTVFTYGGNNPYCPTAEALIVLKQSDSKEALFNLTYGCEITPSLTYSMACRKLGEAMLHHLSCEGIVNNEGL